MVTLFFEKTWCLYSALLIFSIVTVGCGPAVVEESKLWDIAYDQSGWTNVGQFRTIDEKNLIVSDGFDVSRKERMGNQAETLGYLIRREYPANDLVSGFKNYLISHGYVQCDASSIFEWQRFYDPRYGGIFFDRPLGLWVKGREHLVVTIMYRMQRQGKLDDSIQRPDNPVAKVGVLYFDSKKRCMEKPDLQ